MAGSHGGGEHSGGGHGGHGFWNEPPVSRAQRLPLGAELFRPFTKVDAPPSAISVHLSGLEQCIPQDFRYENELISRLWRQILTIVDL